jgi:hypothetical protein
MRSEAPLAADPAALASLDKKLALVKDRVTAVAAGYQTGLYLFGGGGIGKSFTVLARLGELQASYRLFNSRITAKGLFRALERAPDAVHVLEDMERLTNDRDAQGVLRSALWAQPGRDRIVTWTTGTGGEESVTFRGGIVLLANRPLATLPELRALATRITVLRLEVTDGEAVSLMLKLAAGGHQVDGKLVLAAEECVKVTQHMILECRAAGCPLDLRLQVNAYSDYLLWESDQSRCGWQDLVTSRVREAAHHFRVELSRLSQEARRAERRRVVAEIVGLTTDPEERIRLYQERTGKSRADFFRRKQELHGGEFPAEGDDEA